MAPQVLGSDGVGDGKADRNAVFIDTNLDTHLAMIVDHADTVSDLKKRIMLEHPLCFPKIGQIQIHAIKVKRKGYFYHLSDSMLVRSAFNGFNKSWFLSVDATAVMEHEKFQISNNASIGAIDLPFSSPAKRASDFNSFKSPQLESKHDEKEEVPFVSPRVSEHSGKGVVDHLETVVKLSGNDDVVIPSPGSISEEKDQCCIDYELPSSCIEYKGDGFSKGNQDEINVYQDGTLKPVPRSKKKHKSNRKKEDTVWDDAFKHDNASVLGPDKLMVQQEGNIVPENPSENGSREFYNRTMGENNITDEPCENSKTTSSAVQMSNEVSKGAEAPKEHVECNDNSKKNIDAECDKSMTEASEHASTVNKKRGKKKRTLTHDLKEEMLKVERAFQHAEVHKSNEEQKKIEEPNELVETNNDKSGDETELRNDMVSQEPSDIGSPAKKRQKGKERREYESALKEKRSVTGDPNKETLKPENASHHHMEDPPKIKDSSADQSTEHFGDADPLRTSVIGSKRKRKKNSSNKHQTAASASSRNDNAEDLGINGEGVQEEILKEGQISKDISVSNIAGENLEIGANTCKDVTMSKVKRTGNSKDHSSIDVRVHPSDLNETKELTEDKSQAGQTVLAEEGREISPLDDPKHMLLENCPPSNQNNTEANIREFTETSKANESTECGKSEKKRKKKRNTKHAEGGPVLTAGFNHIDASKSGSILVESCQATNCDPTSGNTKTEENLLNQTEGENVSPEEIKGAYLSAIDKEVNDINVGSLENISKAEAHAQNLSEKKSKKSKKKQAPTTKSVSEMLTKDQVLNHEGTSPAPDSRLLVEPSSKKKKKDKSASIKSTDKSRGPILEAERDYIETEAPHSPSNAPKGNYKSPSGANDATITEMPTKDQVLDHEEPSHTPDSRLLVELSSKKKMKDKSASIKSTDKSSGSTLEAERDFIETESPHSPSNAAKGNYKSPSGANDTAINSVFSFGHADDNHLKAPAKEDEINSEQHLASGLDQHKDIVSDDLLVDKNGADRMDIELMTGKIRKEREVMKGDTHTGKLSFTQQLLSKEGDGSGFSPDVKDSKVCRTGQEAHLSSQSNSVTSTIKENKKPQVNKSSGKSKNLERSSEAFPVSNSKLKGHKKVVQNKAGKVSGYNIGGIVSKKEQKKSLLAGTIFKDDSSDTSEDEDDKINDSSSSTRSPSDISLSSDYSDDSDSGSSGGTGLETGGKSRIKSSLSGTKRMPIDSILRSSKRYKKAKVTASQLEETESQPVDFVPDSLADT